MVVPVFLVALFGIVDAGRYFYVAISFNEAAREGARFGSVEEWAFACPDGTSPRDRETCSVAATRNSLVGVPAAFVIEVECGTCRPGDLLSVTVQTPDIGPDAYRFLAPVFGSVVVPPPITGQATVTIQ
jgi:hypothetical protein